MIYLSKEQIIILHSSLISETGGTDGLRDEALLESAIASPLQTFEGEYMFATDMQKNSPFIILIDCKSRFC